MNVPVKKDTTLTLLNDVLTRNQKQLAAVVKKYMPPEMMIATVVNAARRNQDILKALAEFPASVLYSVMHLGTLGLVPNGIEAHLIPRKNKNLGGAMECTPFVDYKGFVKLHRRDNGGTLDARVVYDKEIGEFQAGEDPKIIHRPLPPSERGDIVRAAYAVFFFPDSSIVREWMWAEDLAKVQAAAMTDSIYRAWKEEMQKKAPIRRGAKRVPGIIQMAADTDEGIEQGRIIPMELSGDDVFDLVSQKAQAATAGKADEMAARLDAAKGKIGGDEKREPGQEG